MSAIGRRRFVQAGGGAIAAAAVLAACDGDTSEPEADPRPPSAGDVATLQGASSLEHAALELYTTVLESGILSTQPARDAAELFRAEHEEHARLFERATEEAGGEPDTTADVALSERFARRTAGLLGEPGALELLDEAENVLAHTYQSFVGTFGDAGLNQAAMTVGGAEARHAAVLAQALGRDPAPEPFQPTDLAVTPGQDERAP